MGLPELVNFARNFSVMVRVQGPDPKGLKMRRHAFHHYHSGKTTISASGLLLPESLYNLSAANECFQGDNDQKLVLAITVASVVEPFLSLDHKNNISRINLPKLIHGAQIDIMFEGEKRLVNDIGEMGKGSEHWLSVQLLRLVDVPSSSSALQSLIKASSPQHGWEVGWSLSSHSKDPQAFVDVTQIQSQMHSAVEVTSNPDLMGKSTTRIAVLGVPSIVSQVNNY